MCITGELSSLWAGMLPAWDHWQMSGLWFLKPSPQHAFEVASENLRAVRKVLGPNYYDMDLIIV